MSPVSSKESGFHARLVRRPVGTLVIFATLLVVGLIAYQRIPIQLLPSGYNEPSLWMWISNPGASAQENEELVARVIEEQLRTISGIEDLRSYSESDVVRMRLSFAGNADMKVAKAEVRDRLERAQPSLPVTAQTPQVWSESSDTLPITFFGIRLAGEQERRDHLMEKVVKPRLEAVQGVGKVTIWGVLQDSVRILLDEDKVTAAGIDIGEVIRRLANDNFALPMGELRDGGRELIVRSDMRFQTPEEIGEYPVGNGLKLKDLGRVARVKAVQDQLSRIDGAPAYYGMATKDSQSNVVETSENFRAAIEELEQDPKLAGDVAFMLFFLQGDMIQSALAQLKNTALQGGLLAIIVLLIFLRRLRLTLCVAMSIPVSALLAIAWEYFTGGTFNVLTMTGITLATGMLVDNAVVVVENIARLHREGMTPTEAAAQGAREIALAITLATLTTVVVFMPLIFMTDQAALRVLFGSMGLPLSIALLASLLLAVVFTPVVVARMLGKRTREVGRVGRALDVIGRIPVRCVAHTVGLVRWLWHRFLTGLYGLNWLFVRVLAPLRWVLAPAAIAAAGWAAWRGLSSEDVGATLAPFGTEVASAKGNLVPLVVAALVVAGVALFALKRWRRLPLRRPARPSSFVPGGHSLVDMITDMNHWLISWTLQHRLAATGLTVLVFLSILIPVTQMRVTAFGDDSSGDQLRFRVRLLGQFTLAEAQEELMVYEEFLESKREEYGFAHWSNRFDEDSARFGLHFDETKTGKEFEDLETSLKEDLPRVSGHRLRFYDENQSDGRSNTVARFTLLGPDSEVLEQLGVKAARLLERVPGLSQISTPLESAPDQIEVTIDRDLAHELGVSTRSVENSIAYALGGFPLPRFQEEGREIPFRIELDEEEVAGYSTLADLSVFGDQGAVALSSFAGLSFAKGARWIYRRNGKTSFTLEGKVEDPLQILAVTEAGHRALQELDMPRGYSVDRSDSAVRRQEEEFSELGKAFLLSVVLVFLLMGILFESVMLPFSVLFTIPFAILGSLWTLFLSGTAMDSMGWIGMIILAGVVVNNGIVLIDRIHNLRAKTKTRAEAVMEGCRQRVRPVLMTALTTIVGLFPMIVAVPPRDGFDYRALAAIVAGGLAASTFFTLWVVPLAYTVIDDLGNLAKARMGWWLRRPARRRKAEMEAEAAGA